VVITGLVLNGQKIFEMAADVDHRVTFDGEVERDLRLVTRDMPDTYYYTRCPNDKQTFSLMTSNSYSNT